MKKIGIFISGIMLALVGLGFVNTSKAYAEGFTSLKVELNGDGLVAKGYTEDPFDGNLVIPATAEYEGGEYPLISLINPGSLPSGYQSFNANDNITSIDLTGATNLQNIGDRAFINSKYIVGELYLPSSLVSIGEKALRNSQFTKVYVNRAVTEVVEGNTVFTSDGYTNIANDAFGTDYYRNIEFVFPSQTILDMYKTCGIFALGDCNMTVLEGTEEPDQPEQNEVEVNIVFDYNYESEDETIIPLVRAIGKSFNCEKSGDEWIQNPDYNFPRPEREGCEFVGWSLAEDGEVIDENHVIEENMVSNGSVTLYAIWEENYYDIIYHYDNQVFTDVSLPSQFGSVSGLVLPELTSDNMLIEWNGWYTESTCVTKITEIQSGTAKTVELWSKYTLHTPILTINSTLVSGESYEKLYYGDEVNYTGVLTNYPNGCAVAYKWQMYDTAWIDVSETDTCHVGSKLPNTYQIKCIVVLSKGENEHTIEKVVDHKINKYSIEIDWKTQPNLTYTGNEYVHDFDIKYSDNSIKDSCKYTTYYKNGEEYVECAKVVNAGEYKIVCEILDEYEAIAEISGSHQLSFTIAKYVIESTYEEEYFQREYTGGLYIPNVILNDEDWIGFDTSKLIQTVYYKKANTYHQFAKYALTESVDLTELKNAGQYYFELSIEDENYILKSTYPKQIVLITPKSVKVFWSDINLVYNGSIQVPSAVAYDLSGNKLDLSIKGGQKDANENVEDVYTATVEISNANYTPTNPTCAFYISKAKSFIVHDHVFNNNAKMYDGKKYVIKAVVRDNYGEIADNVVVACATDLTSVGIHTVVLSWVGDKNHFAPNNVTLDIYIKTENIVIENDNSGDILISSSEGFASSDEVLVEDDGKNLVSTSVYNSLNSAYNLKNIYRITNTDSKNLTIRFALPAGVKSTKQLKVFEILENGEMKEVKYSVVDGSIKISSSSEQSTFAVVCVKDNSMTIIIIAVIVGAVVGAAGVMVLIQIRRKKKTKTQ